MKLKITVADIFRHCIFLICAVFCLSAFSACSKEHSSPSMSGIFAADVSVVYDGRQHSITVVNTIASDNVTYSTDEISFSSVNPVFTEVGVYTVYFKVLRSGYPELSSSATVSISPTVLSGISADNISIVYDGLPHSIVIRGTQDLDLLSYSTDGVSFSSDVPEFTEVGNYTVYYCVERPYGEYKSSCTISILPDIYGRYFNPSFGVITLCQYSATVNYSSFPLSFSVSGSGYIDSDPFSVSNGVLYFNDLSFSLLSDSDCVYRLNNSIYFRYSSSGSLSICFKDNVAEISLDENVLLSVPDVNYCVSGVITDYSSLCFQQSFLSSSDITDISVELSLRDMNPITVDCKYYTYDGLPHGFDFSVPVIFPDYTSPPSFTDVGKHTVSVLFLSDTYLPKILSCSIVILPDLSGVYVSTSHVIHISDGAISFDGVYLGELSILNDAWAWNDLPISVSDNGLVYGNVTYIQTTDLMLVIYLNDEFYSFLSVPYSVKNIYISVIDTSLVFEYSKSVQLTVPLDKSDCTITLDGHVITPDLSPPHYSLGIADINSSVIVLYVSCR